MRLLDQFVKVAVRGSKTIVPRSVKQTIWEWRRGRLFQKAMKRFISDPEACMAADSTVIQDLIKGWGNEGWSASAEYLVACVRHSLTARGPVLECGSGLSTILMGTILRQTGGNLWTLEHAPAWATKVQATLDKYELDCVTMCVAPLRDFGAFCWYDAQLDALPKSFSLVICDGPPGSTKGGRYGLASIMKDRLSLGCIILLDDAVREHELSIARRWEDELSGSLEVCGTHKPYVRLTIK